MFTLGDRKEAELLVSSLTIANAYYSILRHHKEVDAKKYMTNFKILVTIFPVDDECIELALASDFSDFEDGLQYFVALENQADLIISRNKKDFKDSSDDN